MAVVKGERFGRLVTLERSGSRNGRAVWSCQCDCGKIAMVSSKHLQGGGATSCGCFRSERIRATRMAEAATFESRLQRMPNGCLEWMGSRDRRGYGTLRAGKRDHKAHRVAYEKAKGPIPPGRFVCHTCDNPPCCEPGHLFLGDAQANSKDMVRKGRQPFGARNAISKVNDHIVGQIRKLEGQLSQQAIADLFGIDQTTVSKIMLKRSWKHVE